MDEELHELVEAYMSNRLSDPERIAFERRLKEEPDFLAEVKPLLAGELAIQMGARKSRLERFDQWYEEAKDEAKSEANGPRLVRLGIILGIAATILVLLLVFVPRSSTPNPQELFAQNFEPYLPPETRSTNNSLDSVIQRTHVEVLKGNYATAIPMLQDLITSYPLDSALRVEERLYLASAYLDNGQVEEAIATLKDPILSEIPAAQWYLALALLKKGDLEGAKTYLEALVQKKVPFYGKKAEEMLN